MQNNSFLETKHFAETYHREISKDTKNEHGFELTFCRKSNIVSIKQSPIKKTVDFYSIQFHMN